MLLELNFLPADFENNRTEKEIYRHFYFYNSTLAETQHYCSVRYEKPSGLKQSVLTSFSVYNEEKRGFLNH